MCQVSCCELSVVDPFGDLGVDFVEGALERSADCAEAGKCGGQSGTQDAVVGAGEEQRGAEAECGDAVSTTGVHAVGQASDQAMETQAAKLICDGALGDRFWIPAGQGGQMVAQIG